jgi:prepilin-type N-terminal cleavage/methylation domain-containing protein
MIRRLKGFTLLEMLLVLAVAASAIVLFLNFTTAQFTQQRRDRTAIQMQQILSAGLAYYVANGSWPTSVAALQGSYLPSGKIVSGWGGAYTITSSASSPLFSVSVTLPSIPEASILAGMVPLGSNTLPFAPIPAIVGCDYMVPTSGLPTEVDINVNVPCGGSCGTLGSNDTLIRSVYSGTCQPPGTQPSTTVTGSVTLPGQNLNNASAINYAGLYSDGACVPAPVCPSGMVAQIFTSPAAVAGVTSVSGCSGSTGNCSVVQTSPIYSFNTYAVGASGANTPVAATPGPVDCLSGGAVACVFTGQAAADPSSTTYWRVCLQVSNQNGTITNTNKSSDQGVNMGEIMAFTRCSTPGEPSGTPVNVWTAP